jgi:hypothetical protein
MAVAGVTGSGRDAARHRKAQRNRRERAAADASTPQTV